MFENHPYPVAGDVLFYTSGKAHALAIKARQQQLGFSRTELMHAAVMVDHRVLTEATTKKGVGYVSLFASRANYDSHRPTAVLRHPKIANDRSVSLELWKHSFYFHEQRYDWIGAVNRVTANDTRKICSTLVQMILSKLDLFSSVEAIHGDLQIYPAELFRVLKDCGFVEIPPWKEPNDLEFGRRDDLMMLNALDEGRKVEKMAASVDHWSFLSIPIQELALIRQKTSGPTERLFRAIMHAQPFDGNVIKGVLHSVQSLEDNFDLFTERATGEVANWKDKEHARQNAEDLRKKFEHQYDLTCQEILALDNTLKSGTVEFLNEAGFSEDIPEFVPDMFRKVLIDTGGEEIETPETLKALLGISQRLEQKRHARIGAFQPDIPLIEPVNTLIETVASANSAYLDAHNTHQDAFLQTFEKVAELVAALHVIVKNEAERITSGAGGDNLTPLPPKAQT